MISFAQFASKTFVQHLDKSLLKLIETKSGEAVEALSALGLPRFFSVDVFDGLCTKYSISSAAFEPFLQPYNEGSELFLTKPVRDILRFFFASQKQKSDQQEDFHLLVSDFIKKAKGAEQEKRTRYDVEAIFLEYLARPEWAIAQYQNWFVIAWSNAINQPALRRLVRALDDYRREKILSKADLSIHCCIKTLTYPWIESDPLFRIKRITAVRDHAEEPSFSLVLSTELIKTLLRVDPKGAIREASKLQKYARTLERADWEFLALRHKARGYLTRDQYKKCLLTIDEASQLMVGRGIATPSNKCALLLQKAEVFRYQGEFDDAEALVDKCIEFYRSHQQPIDFANAISKKAALRCEIGDYGAALELYRSVEPIFSKMLDPVGRGTILHQIATCLVQMGDFNEDEVMRLLDEAEAEHKRGHNTSGQAKVLMYRIKTKLITEEEVSKQTLRQADRVVTLQQKQSPDDVVGLFYAHLLRAEVYQKAKRNTRVGTEIGILKSLNAKIIKLSGGGDRAAQIRVKQIAALNTERPRKTI